MVHELFAVASSSGQAEDVKIKRSTPFAAMTVVPVQMCHLASSHTEQAGLQLACFSLCSSCQPLNSSLFFRGPIADCSLFVVVSSLMTERVMNKKWVFDACVLEARRDRYCHWIQISSGYSDGGYWQCMSIKLARVLSSINAISI